jgi:catechol 2,3-dioxygenase-like lactoylglutathione lyase family enzyme
LSRLQLALNVSDIDEAVAFYSKLFGTQPAKRQPGYANFAITEPTAPRSTARTTARPAAPAAPRTAGVPNRPTPGAAASSGPSAKRQSLRPGSSGGISISTYIAK